MAKHAAFPGGVAPPGKASPAQEKNPAGTANEGNHPAFRKGNIHRKKPPAAGKLISFIKKNARHIAN
jgi:hypothetical protein